MMKLILIPTVILLILYVYLLSLRRPKVYLWLYLLASTRLLGFVDFTSFEIQGVFNVLFCLNVIALLSVAVSIVRSGIPNDKGFRFLYVMAAMTCFGVLYPVLLGYSNITGSVTDGKDFLCYFFLAYLLVNKDKITTDSIRNVITFIGIALSVVVIIAATTGLTPPAYDAVAKDQGPEYGIHIAYATFISLAFFLQFARLIRREYEMKYILMTLVLLAGVILQPHRSVFFGVTAGVVFVILFRSSLNMKMKSAYTVTGALLCIYVFLGSDTLSRHLLEPVQELLYREGAIAARKNIDAFRWEEIWNRPLLGHGFIDERSSFGENFSLTSDYRFSQTLGTIDSGYVDALARFGIIGTIIILAQYIAVLSIPFRIQRYGTSDRLMPAAFLGTYFIISITWSVFTYRHGIIPAAISIFLIVRPESKPSWTNEEAPVYCPDRLASRINRPYRTPTIARARSL